MNSSAIGIIIALLIFFLIGILVGYSLVQKRLRKQTETLKVTQRRLTEMEQSHELRLRETTERLRQDYEAELAETIEHYQDQLSQKTIEMEQIYETRFRVLQRGELPDSTPEAVTANMGLAAVPYNEPQPQPVMFHKGIEPVEASPTQSHSQPELMHLKRQYELRLKEAAQKLQKAYEKQLADHARNVRADLEAEYDRRVNEKLQEYEEQFAQRQRSLEAEMASLRAAATGPEALMARDFEVPTPSEIMGTGDETTVTLAASSPPPLQSQRPPAPHYTQGELEERLEAAREQARATYERQLAERLEAQQAEFDRRLETLEVEFEQKLAEQKQAIDEMAPANAENLFADLDDDEAAPSEKPVDEIDVGDDWMKDIDDDDFGPLDLSDISQLT